MKNSARDNAELRWKPVLNILPEFGERCKLLISLDKPFVLGLEMGAQADVARGGLFPGTLTVVLRRSISFP